jgi:SAM-dependent methyltransferase
VSGAYDAYADGYAQTFAPATVAAAEHVAELSGAAPGVRLLDVATGTGAVARAAAARGASVVGVDSSSAMLAFARDLDVRVADVAALPFADGSFDAATCGLGLSHFGDCADALAEVRRVLRPGATFAASAWANDASIPTAVLDELLPGAGEAVDEATWGDPERGVAVLRSAGFAGVEAHEDGYDGAFADIDEAMAWFLSSPLVAARLARVDSDRFLGDACEALAGASLAWRFSFIFYVASCATR